MHEQVFTGLRALTLVAMAGVAGLVSAADNVAIESFYGRFEGQAISETQGELSKRDISVEVEPEKKGFKLKWVTVTKRSDGRLKRKSYEVNFVPSATENVYASAMRRNLFGKAVPMDPLKGDPYVWATLTGATLVVHALVITDEHGYEMQTYRRTRTADGMRLVFHRVRDGKRLRDVTGTLVKVD